MIACDMHPDYFSTGYASVLCKGNRCKVPLSAYSIIMHILYHAMAEHGLDEKVIGISMDGTGFGTDGNTWGGEFLVADTSDFERYSPILIMFQCPEVTGRLKNPGGWLFHTCTNISETQLIIIHYRFSDQPDSKSLLL